MKYRDSDVPLREVPWSLRDMLFAGLAVVVLIGAGLLSLSVAIVALGLDVSSPEQQRLLAFAMLALVTLMIPPVWWWGLRKHGASARDLGVRGFAPLRGLALTVLGLAAILAINLAWSWVLERLALEGQPSLVPVFGEGLGGFLWALVVAAIAAPVAEELFFRGFLYAGLRQRWGVVAGVVVSSVVFGILHLTPSVALPIILMGAVFAWLYEATDSLWPPIILHALVNGLAVVGLYAAEMLEGLPT